MGKLLVTMVVILFFGCTPDTSKEKDESKSKTQQNSPLNEEVDEVEKLLKKLEK